MRIRLASTLSLLSVLMSVAVAGAQSNRSNQVIEGASALGIVQALEALEVEPEEFTPGDEAQYGETKVFRYELLGMVCEAFNGWKPSSRAFGPMAFCSMKNADRESIFKILDANLDSDKLPASVQRTYPKNQILSLKDSIEIRDILIKMKVKSSFLTGQFPESSGYLAQGRVYSFLGLQCITGYDDRSNDVAVCSVEALSQKNHSIMTSIFRRQGISASNRIMKLDPKKDIGSCLAALVN